MAKNFVQEGESRIWTNTTGSDIASGAVVVVGQRLAIALVDIANTESGVVRFYGVFTVPKVSGAVIAEGETLTWDVSVGAFDDNAAIAAAGDVTGAPAVAFEAAGNGVTSFDVYFTGAPGTVA